MNATHDTPTHLIWRDKQRTNSEAESTVCVCPKCAEHNNRKTIRDVRALQTLFLIAINFFLLFGSMNQYIYTYFDRAAAAPHIKIDFRFLSIVVGRRALQAQTIANWSRAQRAIRILCF